MEPAKTGRFIAQLRRKEGMTQAALGEKLGVTNKTISRWENGNYMPDIEMLQLLSQTFQVGINELLAGQLLSDEELREIADENVVSVLKKDAFSFEEKKKYWKKKWRKEHIGLFAVILFVILAFVIISFVIGKIWMIALVPLAGLVAYGYQNNKMMIYVENRLYDTIK